MRKLTPDDIKLTTKERPLNSLEKDQVLANLDKIKADKTLSRSQKKQAERTANAMISSGANAYINNDKVEFENSLGETVKTNDLHWLDKVAQVITGNEKDTNKYKTALSKGIVDSSVIKAPILKNSNSVREYYNKNQQSPVVLNKIDIPNTKDIWADFDYQDPIVAPVTTKKNTTKGKTAAQIKLEQEAAAKKAEEEKVKVDETSVPFVGAGVPVAEDLGDLDEILKNIESGKDETYTEKHYDAVLKKIAKEKEIFNSSKIKLEEILKTENFKSSAVGVGGVNISQDLYLDPELKKSAISKIQSYSSILDNINKKEAIIKARKDNNIKKRKTAESNKKLQETIIKKDGGIIKLQYGKFFLPQGVIDKQRVYNAYKKSNIIPEEVINPLSAVEQSYYRSKNNPETINESPLTQLERDGWRYKNKNAYGFKTDPKGFKEKIDFLRTNDANAKTFERNDTRVNSELSRIRQPLTTNPSITNPRNSPIISMAGNGKPVLSGVNYNNGVATVGNSQQSNTGSERSPMTGLTRKDNFKINVNKTPISGIQALSAAFPALSMLFSKPTTAYQKYAENYVAPAKGLSQDQMNLTRNQFAANSALGRLNAASTDFRDRLNANAVFNSQQSQTDQNLAVQDAQQFNQAKLAETAGINANNKERNNFTNEMSRLAAEQKNIRNQTIMDSIGKTLGNFGQLYADQANDLNQRKQGAAQLEAQHAQLGFQGKQQGLMYDMQNHYDILSKVFNDNGIWKDPLTGKPLDNQDYYHGTQRNLRSLESKYGDAFNAFNKERLAAAQSDINPEKRKGLWNKFTGAKGNTYKKGGTLNVEERKDLESHKDKLKNAKILDEKIVKLALDIAKMNGDRNDKVSSRNFEKLKLLMSKK